ncbi:uncharacterized protein PGTG_00410 [Puccinia graminis f. sp. tritici CRL 75-36-700-3]|uniref:Uncharacterized protein n=1 Tax=Puccinia graminis f. sp. tritici (strain CRL 75-36-700-3 / race SCCL) TaxID=418459 RepID=E3JRK6_PUCGT|nr:uncharacterized protein PGTG_00410 [Puccinia graminis f. sp. tritici CRL 75-36-700-3]EFP74454.2 hypothetical protein PGTG_00410 [Puccinia graminis f. sp. tritici CRL 75-36-700-3]
MQDFTYCAPDGTNRGPEPSPRAPRVPMNQKLETICALIEELNLTPKSFMVAFLEQDQESMAYKRRLWATDQGWESTKYLLLTIKRLACAHFDGRVLWEDFILSQAIDIVSTQKPITGPAPHGSYHTSLTLSDSFFTKDAREARNSALTDRMPFLYRLICAKIQGNKPISEGNSASVRPHDPIEDDSDDESQSDPSDELVDYDGSILMKRKDPAARRAIRVQTVARTICAMVAFSGNRRHNGFQLSNALLFLAGGVTERVTHAALKSLGAEAKAKLESLYSLGKSPIVAPLLCYDNLDFQEKVHMKSLGHSSRMFHGTWGYVHTIPPSLLSQLDPSELTVAALNSALHLGKELKIRPDMFTPTPNSTLHFELVLKSQITQVILKYLACATNRRVQLHKSPPEINPIAPEDPNITMLKLMVASDNSALGVGEVFTGVIQQIFESNVRRRWGTTTV